MSSESFSFLASRRSRYRQYFSLAACESLSNTARSLANIHSVGIMAIVRIIFTAQSGADASGQWVYAQINVGIVCACLPTLKPLVPKDRTVMITFRNAVSSILLSLKSAGPNFSTKVQATDGRKNSTSTGHRHDRYRNMSSVAFLTEAVGGIEPFDPNRDFPMDKIRVRHDVDVV